MDLIGVGNCLQIRCNSNHTVSCSKSVSKAYATYYTQMVKYGPDVVLKTPVEQLLIDTTTVRQ